MIDEAVIANVEVDRIDLDAELTFAESPDAEIDRGAPLNGQLLAEGCVRVFAGAMACVIVDGGDRGPAGVEPLAPLRVID